MAQAAAHLVRVVLQEVQVAVAQAVLAEAVLQVVAPVVQVVALLAEAVLQVVVQVVQVVALPVEEVLQKAAQAHQSVVALLEVRKNADRHVDLFQIVLSN